MDILYRQQKTKESKIKRGFFKEKYGTNKSKFKCEIIFDYKLGQIVANHRDPWFANFLHALSAQELNPNIDL